MLIQLGNSPLDTIKKYDVYQLDYNEIVIEESEIILHFVHPGDTDFTLTCTSAPGFTRDNLLHAIFDKYREIADTLGRDLCNLTLHGVKLDPDGSYRVLIG
jgi:hypothetical protein